MAADSIAFAPLPRCPHRTHGPRGCISTCKRASAIARVRELGIIAIDIPHGRFFLVIILPFDLLACRPQLGGGPECEQLCDAIRVAPHGSAVEGRHACGGALGVNVGRPFGHNHL